LTDTDVAITEDGKKRCCRGDRFSQGCVHAAVDKSHRLFNAIGYRDVTGCPLAGQLCHLETEAAIQAALEGY
jgi:hypothetical protein